LPSRDILTRRAQNRARQIASRGVHRPNNGKSKAYRVKLRRRAIAALGGHCQARRDDGTVCGFADPRALQFDHIEPVRRGRNGLHKSAQTSDKVHRAILSGKTAGIQLLCANCHMIKTRADEEAGLSINLDLTGGRVEPALPNQMGLFE
jgi:hypothetical protein